MKIRITESQLEELREKYKLRKDKDNTSKGGHDNSNKDPYVKKGFLFIKLDSNKNVPKDCHYFTKEEANELNEMGRDLEALKVAYDDKLKSLTGDKKNKSKE